MEREFKPSRTAADGVGRGKVPEQGEIGHQELLAARAASVVISLVRLSTGTAGLVCPPFKKSFAPPQIVMSWVLLSVLEARYVLI